MTTTRLTASQLAEMSSFNIASELGLAFTGDTNCMDHGGTFYETRNWRDYGYASCLAFIPLEDGELLVECGSINRAEDMASCLETIGFHGEPTTEVEIEACLATWGFEVDEDFSGRFAKKFKADEAGYIDEETVWLEIIGWLYGICE